MQYSLDNKGILHIFCIKINYIYAKVNYNEKLFKIEVA